MEALIHLSEVTKRYAAAAAPPWTGSACRSRRVRRWR